MQSALVGVGVRQHAPPESISKRAPVGEFLPLRHRPRIQRFADGPCPEIVSDVKIS